MTENEVINLNTPPGLRSGDPMKLASLPTYVAYAMLPMATSFATRMAPAFFAIALLLALLSIRLSHTPDSVYWRNFFTQFRNPAVLTMLGLIALSALSTLWSIHPTATRQESLKLTLIFITALLWLPAYQLIDITPIRTALILGVCVALCLITVQYSASYSFRQTYFHEVSPYFINRAVLTQAVFAATLLCVSRDENHRRIPAQVWTVVALSILVSSTSYSSTTMLFWGVFLSIYVSAAYFPRSVLIGSTAVAIVTLTIFPFLHMLQPILLLKAVHLDAMSLIPRSGQLRLEIWQDYLPFIHERWFAGAGFATEDRYLFPAGSDGQPIAHRHPHNLALQLWSNLGFVGIFLSSCFIAFFALIVSRLPPLKMASTTALGFALFVVWMVSHGAWQGWWLSTVVITMAAVVLTNGTQSYVHEPSRAPHSG